MLARTGSTAGKARLFTVLCFCGGLHWWKTNKNGEVWLRLTALWLSVARLHLKRGRLEKKKKAELNIAERGYEIFS